LHHYHPGNALGTLRGIDSKAYNFLKRLHVKSTSQAEACEVFLPLVIKHVLEYI